MQSRRFRRACSWAFRRTGWGMVIAAVLVLAFGLSGYRAWFTWLNAGGSKGGGLASLQAGRINIAWGADFDPVIPPSAGKTWAGGLERMPAGSAHVDLAPACDVRFRPTSSSSFRLGMASIAAPGWLIAFVGGSVGALASYRRRFVLLDEGRCLRCEYPLRTLPWKPGVRGITCPECGKRNEHVWF